MKGGNSAAKGDYYCRVTTTANGKSPNNVEGMTLPRIFFCLFLLTGLLISSAAAAETRFVYPDIDIPVRRGLGEQYKIIKMVRASDPVELLEEKDGWAKVRLAGGTEGWLLQRLLTSDLPPAQRLESLQAENEQCKMEINELNMKLTELKEMHDSGDNELISCKSELDTIQAEHGALEEATTTFRFLAGAGVLLVGWLIGRISSGSRKKRSRFL